MLQEKISKSEIELMNSTDEFSKLQHEFSKSQQELSKLGQELSQSRQECLNNGSYQELYNGGFQTSCRKSVKFSDLSKIVGQSSRTPKMVTIGVFKTWIAIS